MSKFVRVENEVAVDVVTGDPSTMFHPSLACQFVACPDEVCSGWTLSNGKWSAPVVVEQSPVEQTSTPVVTTVEKLAFMSLFKDEELAAIYSTAKEQVMVEVWLDKLKLATFVDLADQRTIDGVNGLVAANLLTAPRAKAILANEAV